MPTELRNFLALPYDELEELNLQAKEQRKNRVAAHKIQEQRLKYLTDEPRIKAVTVMFSDLEGRLHMLDYDKKFLVKSWDNLTFATAPTCAASSRRSPTRCTSPMATR
jgi:glutamine synthetase